MLQQFFKERMAGIKVDESVTEVDSELDPEIEMVLPIIAKENEFSDYRIILKQLKKRNSQAFQRLINQD